MKEAQGSHVRRVVAAEKKVRFLEFGRDARLVAALERGKFTSGDLDVVYDVIGAPFRSAMLATAAYIRRRIGSFVLVPPWPLGQFAMFIAFRTDDEIPEGLRDCSLALSVPEDVVDPTYLFWADADMHARRGLVQRLAEHHGLEALRDDVDLYLSTDDPGWPLPVLTNPESERVLRLVSPLVDRSPLDIPLLLWRNEEGVALGTNPG